MNGAAASAAGVERYPQMATAPIFLPVSSLLSTTYSGDYGADIAPWMHAFSPCKRPLCLRCGGGGVFGRAPSIPACFNSRTAAQWPHEHAIMTAGQRSRSLPGGWTALLLLSLLLTQTVAASQVRRSDWHSCFAEPQGTWRKPETTPSLLLARLPRGLRLP